MPEFSFDDVKIVHDKTGKGWVPVSIVGAIASAMLAIIAWLGMHYVTTTFSDEIDSKLTPKLDALKIAADAKFGVHDAQLTAIELSVKETNAALRTMQRAQSQNVTRAESQVWLMRMSKKNPTIYVPALDSADEVQ